MKRFHFVTLYITRRCDLACSYCSEEFHLPISGRKAPTDMPFDKKWKEILTRWAPETEYFSILGGEPTLHKDLPQIVNFLHNQKVKFGITTDGRLSATEYSHLVAKGLPEIALSIDSIAGNHNDKSARIKSERNFRLIHELSKVSVITPNGKPVTLIACMVVSKRNIQEVHILAKLFTDMGVIFAPCPVQQGYHESLSVASNGADSAAHPSDLADVGRWLLENYKTLLLAEPQSYYDLWIKHASDMSRAWHCNDELRAPSIDHDGTMWGCYAYQGAESKKLHALTASWEEINQAFRKDMSVCQGCSWNCLYSSNGITDGTIDPNLWV